MEYTLRATTVVPAAPDDVFDTITDLERLPDWNLEIPRVVEVPEVLRVGASWVVTVHAMKTHWDSRSTVVELDRERGRFSYRSQTVDGNPSHADWRWQLTPAPDGAGTEVTVEVDIRPRTFWRKRLFSEVRRSSLRKAMQTSLTALREHETNKERS
jgi:uncharacterized protein YndB with AHSA1/START domain